MGLMFCYSCYLERGLEFLLKSAGSSLLSLHVEDCGVFITDRCIKLMILMLRVQNLRPIPISEIYARVFPASK